MDLLTALDLAHVDNARLGYSPVFIDKVIGDINSKIRRLDLNVSVHKKRIMLLLVPLAIILVFGFLWLRFDAPTFSYSLTRLAYLWGLSDNNGMTNLSSN